MYPDYPQNRNRPVVFVLLLCFLMQPLLTYLGTPWFVSDQSGITSIVCTLEGLKSENIDASSDMGKLLGMDIKDCPALELIDMMSAGLFLQPASFQSHSWYTVALLNQTVTSSFLHSVPSVYQPRAPPFVEKS